MTSLARYLPATREHKPSHIAAGLVPAVSSTWIMLQDIGWLVTIGFICVGTFAVSSIAAKARRSQ